MSNHASRKGIGAKRSDYDRMRDELGSVGLKFSEDEITRQQAKLDGELPHAARKALSFHTSVFVFDGHGAYLGLQYMSRDECDYFEAREEAAK